MDSGGKFTYTEVTDKATALSLAQKMVSNDWDWIEEDDEGGPIWRGHYLRERHFAGICYLRDVPANDFAPAVFFDTETWEEITPWEI